MTEFHKPGTLCIVVYVRNTLFHELVGTEVIVGQVSPMKPNRQYIHSPLVDRLARRTGLVALRASPDQLLPITPTDELAKRWAHERDNERVKEKQS